MGEGWSDFFSTAIRVQPGDTRSTDYVLGTWVLNNTQGVRTYPYSTNLTTNPWKYTSVNNMFEVHDVGEVWATVLNEMMWNLIDKHGKNDAAKPTFDSRGVPTDGKFLSMKLVVDAMAL
jgi:extracellular elastinolytic metalloproteinase